MFEINLVLRHTNTQIGTHEATHYGCLENNLRIYSMETNSLRPIKVTQWRLFRGLKTSTKFKGLVSVYCIVLTQPQYLSRKKTKTVCDVDRCIGLKVNSNSGQILRRCVAWQISIMQYKNSDVTQSTKGKKFTSGIFKL